jgi:hypothetical protein
MSIAVPTLSSDGGDNVMYADMDGYEIPLHDYDLASQKSTLQRSGTLPTALPLEGVTPTVTPQVEPPMRKLFGITPSGSPPGETASTPSSGDRGASHHSPTPPPRPSLSGDESSPLQRYKTKSIVLSPDSAAIFYTSPASIRRSAVGKRVSVAGSSPSHSSASSSLAVSPATSPPTLVPPQSLPHKYLDTCSCQECHA